MRLESHVNTHELKKIERTIDHSPLAALSATPRGIAAAANTTHQIIAPRPNTEHVAEDTTSCLLYTSPSPRDRQKSRMPSSA